MTISLAWSNPINRPALASVNPLDYRCHVLLNALPMNVATDVDAIFYDQNGLEGEVLHVSAADIDLSADLTAFRGFHIKIETVRQLVDVAFALNAKRDHDIRDDAVIVISLDPDMLKIEYQSICRRLEINKDWYVHH